MDKRPLRVGLVFLSAALALAAMLLTGCGGSDDRAKVEASLRHYMGTLGPEHGAFLIGGGPSAGKEPRAARMGTSRLKGAKFTLFTTRP